MNNDIIGVSQASKILGISASTLRRHADEGKIPFISNNSNKYRKFYREDILKYRNELYEKKETFQFKFDIFEKKSTQSNLRKLVPKSHPSHYLMHKYWGRKPHNVVSEYINHFSMPNDKVLDPFAGSGMTPIEAIKINRVGIGIDINPMSKFIATNTVSKVSLKEYECLAKKIINDVSDKYKYLYKTTCNINEEIAIVESFIWENDKLVKIRAKSPSLGVFIKDPDNADIELVNETKNLRKSLEKENTIQYPKDEILQYVRRSGNKNISDLFSDRALIILSEIKKSISNVDDKKMKSLLMFTFTSMLANVSNMLPGDINKATYKSGWVISKFWTPKVHTERNIFNCFNLRVKAIIKGKSELADIRPELLHYYIQDSSNLSLIESESIDYIFTDPPYGESIAYLALSQFWNSWLDNLVDYNNEIIIDRYRNKSYQDYSIRMEKTFNELYRVLKDKHYMSFTFHNRDLLVWKSVMDACKNSGFKLVEVTLQQQAVSSGTQGINKTNTLTGDFVYTFKKDIYNNEIIYREYINNPEEFIYIEIDKIITQHKEITPSKLYEILIPIIVENDVYVDNYGNAINIESILKDNYIYEINKKDINKLGENYVWKKLN